MNELPLDMKHYCLKVLNIFIFIYPFIPLSILFAHFSGLFPVPYRICNVCIRFIIRFKCCQFLRPKNRIKSFLIKIHSKHFGLNCCFVFFMPVDEKKNLMQVLKTNVFVSYLPVSFCEYRQF